MTSYPPKRVLDLSLDNPAAALDYEIAQEKASALGRLGRAFDAMALEVAETQTRLRHDIAERVAR